MNPLFWVVSWTSLFREIFSTTSLFLLNNISKQLADKLSSISEAPKRGAGLNLFPYLWTARDLGGGWDCRDHPDGTQRAPCRWTLGVHLETQGTSDTVGFPRCTAEAAGGQVSALEWFWLKMHFQHTSCISQSCKNVAWSTSLSTLRLLETPTPH